MDDIRVRDIEAYAELVDLARHVPQSFQRQISTAVYHTERGVLAVAVLLDTYHDMRMAVLVDPENQEIADIQAALLRFPFQMCPETPEVYRKLIGLKLYEPGTMRRIHSTIPKKDGCTHLYAVLEACLRALFIGGRGGRPEDSVYMKIKDLGVERARVEAMGNPLLKGTCLSFTRPPLEEPAGDSST